MALLLSRGIIKVVNPGYVRGFKQRNNLSGHYHKAKLACVMFEKVPISGCTNTAAIHVHFKFVLYKR